MVLVQHQQQVQSMIQPGPEGQRYPILIQPQGQPKLPTQPVANSNPNPKKKGGLPKSCKSQEAYERVKQRAKERYYRNREAILERAREHYRLKSAMGGSRRNNPSAKSVEAYLRHKERVKQRYYENKEQHLQRARDNYRKRKALSAEVSEALKVGRPLTPQQYEFWKKNQNLVEGKLKPGKPAKKKPKKTDIKTECMDIVNDLYKDKFTHIKLEQLQPSPQQQQQQQQQLQQHQANQQHQQHQQLQAHRMQPGVVMHHQAQSVSSSPMKNQYFPDGNIKTWLGDHPEANCISIMPLSHPQQQQQQQQQSTHNQPNHSNSKDTFQGVGGGMSACFNLK